MAMSNRPDVQRELMRILQENAASNNNNSADGDESINNETGDYSVLMNGSVMSACLEEDNEDFDDEEDSLPDSSAVSMKRGRKEAFGEETTPDDGDNLQKQKRPYSETGVDDSYFEEVVDEQEQLNETMASSQHTTEEVNDLRATVEKLQKELKQFRDQEMNLTLKIDEMESQHRGEMIRVESEALQIVRGQEEKYSREVSDLKHELETLRDCDVKSKEYKEEVTRLRDELDVLQFSKEKLSFTEEQLRKCREKIELIGDAQDALEREEKAHASVVEKCIELENELSQLKPLKRQLEEYKVRATDSEVALTECREDLRRLKERSSGLEGANEALKRGVSLQQAEAGSLQRLLQEEGGEDDGVGIGIGISELNPELMQELMTLRSEYSRLKEFESKRETDAVQRMEESCDDAKRLSDKFKEQFIRTKNELEDTQQLLRESEAREAKLKVEVAEWSVRYTALGEEMQDERNKSHKAALDAERNFQNEKKALIDQSRQHLKELEEKLTVKLEQERKQHTEKQEQLITGRNELEARLLRQLTEVREQSSATLRSVKEISQTKIEELEQQIKDGQEKAKKDLEDQQENLKVRGKGVLSKVKNDAEAKMNKIKEQCRVEIGNLQAHLDRVTEFQQDYERKAQAKISKREQQLKLITARHREAERSVSELEDKCKKAESATKQLAGDNDRLRRQLGSRGGPGGASQSQVDELMSVCNSLRDENRRLKESGFLSGRAAAPSLNNDASQPSSAISKSALIEYREEFEERIQALEDEKRDLVMRNSAAMTDVQKAEQRAWELEEQLAEVKSQLTHAQLQNQRKDRRADFSAGLNSNSKSRTAIPPSAIKKENATPNINHRTRDFTPKSSSTKKDVKAQPSLMDLTTMKSYKPDADANPECKQS